MDSIHSVNFTVEAIHTDCFGRAKPSALVYFIQQAAGEHCALLGVDATFLEDKNLFWAVTRTKMEIPGGCGLRYRGKGAIPGREPVGADGQNRKDNGTAWEKRCHCGWGADR